MKLSELMAYVADRWEFIEDSYPGIDQLPPDRRLAFCLGHAHQHASGGVGAVAKVLEPLNHGLPLDRDKLRSALADALIATLRAAEVAGISADDLHAEVRKYFTL